MTDPREEFLEIADSTLSGETLIALVLSNPKSKDPAQPRKESIRPIQLQGELKYQWELQFERQQTHQNLDRTESLKRLGELFGSVYRNANLFSSEADVIARTTSGGIRLRQQAPSRAPQAVTLNHNRQKEYLISAGTPCPFLQALDVMTATGQVKQSRQKKFRQINRYLEIVNDVYSHLPETGTLKVVDFGCGLSYLTFALHHLLTVIHQREVELLGIDQNEHVISRCREIAGELSLRGIEFSSGKIDQQTETLPVDLAVSLHACDTATDHALAYSVSAQAKVILAAPCCQHELSTRIESSALERMLRHGVLKERFSALATDTLRSCALEAAGYRTQILEFIDLEHTPKNLLLRAVRREGGQDKLTKSEQGRTEYDDLKRFLGVKALSSDLIRG